MQVLRGQTKQVRGQVLARNLNENMQMDDRDSVSGYSFGCVSASELPLRKCVPRCEWPQEKGSGDPPAYFLCMLEAVTLPYHEASYRQR